MATVDVPKTLGALLLGGLFAAFLSGGVTVQVVLYFKLYATDPFRVKALVLAIWFLDIVHTSLIWGALFQYLIFDFGNVSKIDFITWCVLDHILTISLCYSYPLRYPGTLRYGPSFELVEVELSFNHIPADSSVYGSAYVPCSLVRHFVAYLSLMTYPSVVGSFLAHRIWMLSQRNWLLTIPIIVLAILRLASASATTAEMIRLHSFSEFKANFRWLFTLGLALSSTVDIIITASLLFLLHGSRTSTNRLNAVIDSMIRYAFETGSLTCAGTIVTMLCWLSMRKNLIFMGLHFVISKLYGNSLLVILNTRQILRRAQSAPSRSGRFGYPIFLNDPQIGTPSDIPSDIFTHDIAFNKHNSQKMDISITKSVEHAVDGPASSRIHR